MKIEMKKFGDLLISRPDGKAAAMATLSFHSEDLSKIEIDFDGVLALAPGFIHEYINVISQAIPGITFEYLPSQNASVNESLKFL